MGKRGGAVSRIYLVGREGTLDRAGECSRKQKSWENRVQLGGNSGVFNLRKKSEEDGVPPMQWA